MAALFVLSSQPVTGFCHACYRPRKLACIVVAIGLLFAAPNHRSTSLISFRRSRVRLTARSPFLRHSRLKDASFRQVYVVAALCPARNTRSTTNHHSLFVLYPHPFIRFIIAVLAWGQIGVWPDVVLIVAAIVGQFLLSRPSWCCHRSRYRLGRR